MSNSNWMYLCSTLYLMLPIETSSVCMWFIWRLLIKIYVYSCVVCEYCHQRRANALNGIGSMNQTIGWYYVVRHPLSQLLIWPQLKTQTRICWHNFSYTCVMSVYNTVSIYAILWHFIWAFYGLFHILQSIKD